MNRWRSGDAAAVAAKAESREAAGKDLMKDRKKAFDLSEMAMRKSSESVATSYGDVYDGARGDNIDIARQEASEEVLQEK